MSGSCDHVRVKLVRAVRRPRSSRVVLLVASALLASIALAGCGGSSKPKVEPTIPTPSTSIPVPAGVKLTAAGAKLSFGQSADVVYEPNPQRGSVLELTVSSVTQGTIADLSSYQLDDRTKASTPYYVQVAVKNLGNGDVGNTPVPLYLADNESPPLLINPSTFNNTFTKCPSRPLPASFPPNATTTGCLVYLVPNHGTMTAVSFRPLMAFEPIVWTGTVTPPPTPKAKTKKKAS